MSIAVCDVRDNQVVDFQDSHLLKAARLCSADIRTEHGLGAADVLDYREARTGAFLAELRLLPADDGGRAIPIPPDGLLQPMWDIGGRTPEGEPLLSIAGLWVEGRDPLAPGGRARVRLLPLAPERWRHLKSGVVITMHEMRPPAGTARIIEVLRPATT